MVRRKPFGYWCGSGMDVSQVEVELEDGFLIRVKRMWSVHCFNDQLGRYTLPSTCSMRRRPNIFHCHQAINT